MKKHTFLTVTKEYRDLPAAHRQPQHDGHCRLIHGHNWGFDITFACNKLDACGFVVDVGKLTPVKSFLQDKFDHTLLLAEGDELTDDGFLSQYCNTVVLPGVGMEDLAKYVFKEINKMLRTITGPKTRGLCVISVTCWEDSKNRATYTEL